MLDGKVIPSTISVPGCEVGEVPIFLQSGITAGQETVADNAVVTPIAG
jgi:hypothetical protein